MEQDCAHVDLKTNSHIGLNFKKKMKKTVLMKTTTNYIPLLFKIRCTRIMLVLKLVHTNSKEDSKEVSKWLWSSWGAVLFIFLFKGYPIIQLYYNIAFLLMMELEMVERIFISVPSHFPPPPPFFYYFLNFTFFKILSLIGN